MHTSYRILLVAVLAATGCSPGQPSAEPQEPVQCPAGRTACDAGCVDTATDARHCGSCDVACPQGYSCVAGACHGACDSPNVACDQACVDIRSNPDHCGGCATHCPTAANATRGCVMGVCVLSACNTGFFDCDGEPGSGCEVDVLTDIANCGACGKACELANATPSCAAGACAVAVCDAGFADCDQQAGDGCEATLLTDAKNCGACGKACALANATPSCVAGACAVAVCDAGFADCDQQAGDGCEATLLTDAKNCGACGKVCPLNNSCVGGVCKLVLALSFAAAVNWAGGDAQYVANGDLNGDGRVDLVLCDQSRDDVSVYLGAGNGTFTFNASYLVKGPKRILVRDLNGDGRLDVGVTSYNVVGVLAGRGDGTLQIGAAYDVPDDPHEVVAGDFDRDGRIDLVTGNYHFDVNDLISTVTSLVGTNNGSLAYGFSNPTVPLPSAVAVADFDCDGILDLAVAGAGAAGIMKGNGNGSFQAATTSMDWFDSIGAADLNGDGFAELVAGEDNSVVVMLGKGDGTFQGGVAHPAPGARLYDIAFADYNLDGHLDVALASNDTSSVLVYLGNGDGTLRPFASYPVSAKPVSLTTADFNGDGQPDLATGNDVLINTSH